MRDPLLERLCAATRGEYEIVRRLGRGRLAAVYLARDVGLDRPVAIKVLLPDHARSHATSQRFLRAAGAAASLDAHPNAVRVFRAPERDGLRFVVMQYIDGGTLATLLRRGMPLSCDPAAHVVAQVALALQHAHAHGVVHGGVEPGNVFVDRDGGVVVTDFGIAAIAERRRGATVGTPEYTSPEQWRGAEPTPASDQYALGVLAYETLAGAPPFAGTAVELRHAHLESEPPPVGAARPECPPPLAAIVHRMLAKEPGERFPDLAAAHAALVALAGDDESAPRPEAALRALVAAAAPPRDLPREEPDRKSVV